ncbi:hypothetical protein BDZ45DRAFT_799990 [Acephala macrosclerotiorum]|nr:hypothetical protein BDZ45DRAFT_799990 [Acephala macrosclerotiorum]
MICAITLAESVEEVWWKVEGGIGDATYIEGMFGFLEDLWCLCRRGGLQRRWKNRKRESTGKHPTTVSLNTTASFNATAYLRTSHTLYDYELVNEADINTSSPSRTSHTPQASLALRTMAPRWPAGSLRYMTIISVSTAPRVYPNYRDSIPESHAIPDLLINIKEDPLSVVPLVSPLRACFCWSLTLAYWVLLLCQPILVSPTTCFPIFLAA